jgi:hypothetical protein
MKNTIVISLVALLLLSGCNKAELQKSKNEQTIAEKATCIDQKFDPNVNCRVIDYLEKKTLLPGTAGVIFCSYTSLNDNPDENPLYVLASCREYHPVDYELQCETPDKLKKCFSPKNLTQAEYPYKKEETCSSECRYMKLDKQELDQGAAYTAAPMKIIMNEDGTISHEQAMDGEGYLTSIKNMYPESIFDKFLSKEYDKRKELILRNARKAEAYFKMEIGNEVRNRWPWSEK